MAQMTLLDSVRAAFVGDVIHQASGYLSESESDVRRNLDSIIPVTLAAIKADPAFKDLGLVRQGRLSVVPVPDALWKKLLEMSR